MGMGGDWQIAEWERGWSSSDGWVCADCVGAAQRCSRLMTRPRLGRSPKNFKSSKVGRLERPTANRGLARGQPDLVP